MNDYPRPHVQEPARPYPPDRIVAIVIASLLLLSTTLWLIDLLRRPNAEAILHRWWAHYIVTEVAAWLLYACVFLNYARSRFWAHITTFFLTGLSIWSNLIANHPSHAVFGFILLVYTVARLFGIFGPRPLRRLDVLQT